MSTKPKDKSKLFWPIFLSIVIGMGAFLWWPKHLKNMVDSSDLGGGPFAKAGKNNPNLQNYSQEKAEINSQSRDSIVQETLVKQDCGPFHHWNNVQDLKKDLQQDKKFQLVWATWHGNAEGQKISWQFFLRPPAFAIVDSLFFILDANDVPMKQDKIPAPFTNPNGQLIFERIQILESSYPDSHWQFALTFNENKNQVTSMIWEENEGFTTCEKNHTP